MHDTDSYAKRQNICMNTHKNGGDFKNTNSMHDIPEAKLTDEHQKMWDELLDADILTDTASQEIIYLMQDMQLAFQSLHDARRQHVRATNAIESRNSLANQQMLILARKALTTAQAIFDLAYQIVQDLIEQHFYNFGLN